jgi:hypothetical protein
MNNEMFTLESLEEIIKSFVKNLFRFRVKFLDLDKQI